MVLRTLPFLSSPTGRRLAALALALAGWLLHAPTLHAGEVRFGAKELPVDDDGRITFAGRKASTDALPSAPGELRWDLYIWAHLDKGARGPLFLDFFADHPLTGKRYRVGRFEEVGYDGSPYASIHLQLDGNLGFNKGWTYVVHIKQQDRHGKWVLLGFNRIKLEYTEARAANGPGGEQGDDEDDEQYDWLEEEDQGKGDETPPPVKSDPAKKRGCSLHASGGGHGALVLLAFAALTRRRRALCGA